MRRCSIRDCDAPDQIAAEKRWLSARVALQGNRGPLPQWANIVERIEKVLASPRLVDTLRALAEHNRNRARPFLLAPYLRNILNSIEGRKTASRSMPDLTYPRAEVRKHFQEASAKARALSRLVRRGPQPLIALAACDEMRKAIAVIEPCPLIQSSSSKSVELVRFDSLLREAAAALDDAARKIPRTGQNRKLMHGPKEVERLELVRLAAERLATAFRTELKRPCYSHVANIVSELTGFALDDDYVKKIEKRGLARGRE